MFEILQNSLVWLNSLMLFMIFIYILKKIQIQLRFNILTKFIILKI